ncbi:RNA polymerase sigma factor [Lacticaseibacillus absianus]|uniref:RNA polymerase sigma factor n=1 Tax=Lacticaseibacillus absianus TaxID=2729623 RepID=UPI0015C87839|nr:sigma-70 family RNA polymerase sigma factor [Lacticaseibacillus absianus]
MAGVTFDDHLLALGRQVVARLAVRGISQADAEDAVGTAFERIYQLLPELTLTNLDGWFYRVALNAYLDAWRHRRKEALGAAVPAAAAPPPAQFATLIAPLNARDREILALKYYYGFSYQEIASALTLKPETVKKQLQRARARLRPYLEDDHDGP